MGCWPTENLCLVKKLLTKYKGNLLDGLLFGPCLIIFGNGGFLFGKFQEGRVNGSAIIKHGNGDIFAGKWKYGIKHGLYLNFKFKEKTFVYEKYLKGKKFHQGEISHGTPSFEGSKNSLKTQF